MTDGPDVVLTFEQADVIALALANGAPHVLATASRVLRSAITRAEDAATYGTDAR